MPAFNANEHDLPGFRYHLDGGQARRQLIVSVLVIALLAVAIVAAALSLDLRPVGARTYAVTVPAMTMRQAAEHWTADGSKS